MKRGWAEELLLRTRPDEEAFEALYVGACSELDGEGDPKSDHSFPPSPTVIEDYVNSTLVCSPSENLL